MEENEIIRKEAQPVNNMEPKKGNSLTIILAVIAFLALGALAYVLFFKDKGEETDKGKTPEPTPIQTTSSSLEEKYPDWMNYILKQNIKKIRFERIFCDFENGNYGELTKQEEYTTEKLKNIFNKLASYSIMREYLGGTGGDDCGDKILVVYEKNSIEYTFRITTSSIESYSNDGQDAELMSILEKENMDTKRDDDCDDPNQHCSPYYYFVNPMDNLDKLIGN